MTDTAAMESVLTSLRNKRRRQQEALQETERQIVATEIFINDATKRQEKK